MKSRFYNEKIRENDCKDCGIKMKKVLELIKGSKYEEELKEILNIKLFENDIVQIQGLDLLINRILIKEKSVTKFDLISKLKDIKINDYHDKKQINVTFSNVNDVYIKEIVGGDCFTAKTIYYSKADLLNGLFDIDKYTNFCIREEMTDLIKYNIDTLLEKYKNDETKERNYRIVKDGNGNYYLRAITSTDHYHNYGIKLSVFLIVFALHKQSKNNHSRFKLNFCEFTESFIRMYFEKVDSIVEKDDYLVNYTIEVINNEIKTEALNFVGNYYIALRKNNDDKNSDKIQSYTYLKPRNMNSKLESIKHNLAPKNLPSKLKFVNNLSKLEDEMIEIIDKVSNIKNPDMLKNIFLYRIERSRSASIKEYKKEIKKLNRKIKSVSELLEIFNKAEIIADSIEAKDYIRYIVYDLIKGNKK